MGLHLIKGNVALLTFENLHVEQSRIFPNTRSCISPIEKQKKKNLSSSILFGFLVLVCCLNMPLCCKNY